VADLIDAELPRTALAARIQEAGIRLSRFVMTRIWVPLARGAQELGAFEWRAVHLYRRLCCLRQPPIETFGQDADLAGHVIPGPCPKRGPEG